MQTRIASHCTRVTILIVFVGTLAAGSNLRAATEFVIPFEIDRPAQVSVAVYRNDDQRMIPEYRINEEGTLAEWIPEGRPQRCKHRHLPHLDSCYEALDDLGPERTPKLWRAAQEARRAAFLRIPEVAYGRLEVMPTGQSMYPSMMCSHEPDGRIFNCDANGAMPEMVHRMVLQSRPGILDLLPALPEAWPKGEIRGTLARRQITINRLAWDKPVGTVHLKLTSGIQHTISLRLREKRQELVLMEDKLTEVIFQ